MSLLENFEEDATHLVLLLCIIFDLGNFIFKIRLVSVMVIEISFKLRKESHRLRVVRFALCLFQRRTAATNLLLLIFHRLDSSRYFSQAVA